jgi:hypothetical protein
MARTRFAHDPVEKPEAAFCETTRKNARDKRA